MFHMKPNFQSKSNGIRELYVSTDEAASLYCALNLVSSQCFFGDAVNQANRGNLSLSLRRPEIRMSEILELLEGL